MEKLIFKFKFKKAFTLIELLIVVGIVVLLSTVAVIAINPAKQFKKAHDVQRRMNIRTIWNATNQYATDHKGAGLPEVDTTLRMIGTATSGCDVICGTKISKINNDQEKNRNIGKIGRYFSKKESTVYAAQIAQNFDNQSEVPNIISASVEPVKVVPGDIMLVKTEIKDNYGINSVIADMGGIEKIELELKEGNSYQGTWEAEWKVRDTERKGYVTTIIAANVLNLFSKKEINWIDPPSGWVLPTGYEDPGSQWSNEPNVYDGDIGTYASNNYGSSGWGQFIVVTLPGPIVSDRVRINADYMDSDITEVDVDVFEGGTWVHVFQGGNENDWNCKWVELSFAKSATVTKARFRYNYKRGGFYYWLYEFQFYETSLTINPPACATQDAISVEENTANLLGLVINDGGEPCQYRFQYGKTIVYGNNTDWKSGKITGDGFNESIFSLDNSSEYHFQAQVKNSAGTVDCGDKAFTTAPASTGWVLPTGYADPDNKWGDETYAFDGYTITYARSYHNIGDPQWSSFIYFTHLAMVSNKLRFSARGGSQVSSVDVDVFKDGIWVHVFEGAFNDKQWTEESFSEGVVSQARIRFYATLANEGFYWQLYEFDFQKLVETNAVSCLDLTSSLVPDYISFIPYDPVMGSPERTYYAIKKSPGGIIMIKSCSPESGEEIIVQ
ncbi:MAG: type II secretion system protein [Candidatus Nealsonbacteria bacterium]|nr:type II secretion system protein [Candidatus Nealsonbacteria bacterium]